MRRRAAHSRWVRFAPLSLAGVTGWRWMTVFCWVWLMASATTSLAQTSWDLARRPFRFSFTSSMFGDIRENDARAVVKGWGVILSQQLGLDVDPESRIYRSVDEVGRALAEGETDAVSMTVREFWSLPSCTNLVERLMIGMVGETGTEEYVILVRQDASFQRLSDLRDKVILTYEHPRMSAAEAWLEVALAAEVDDRREEPRPVILRERKLAKVVLPLFFRKADACLVNRKGFATMCEMNPQLRRDLRELVVSPPLLPMGFFFRRGFARNDADRMINAFYRLPETPAGQQVLQVFQCTKVREEPMDALQTTLALFDRHHLLMGGAGTQTAKEVRP